MATELSSLKSQKLGVNAPFFGYPYIVDSFYISAISVIRLSLYLPHHLPHCIINIVYSTPPKKNRDHFNLPRYVLVGWYSIFLRLFSQHIRICQLYPGITSTWKLGRCHGQEQVGESLRFQGRKVPGIINSARISGASPGSLCRISLHPSTMISFGASY